MQPLRARFLSLALALASWLVFAGGAAFAQTRELSSSGELLDRIAAVVNEGVVLVSQLDAQTDEVIERLRQQKTELPPRNVLRRQLLERLIVEEIQMQRAVRIGIEVPEEMLNGALNEVAQRNRIGFAGPAAGARAARRRLPRFPRPDPPAADAAAAAPA